MMNQEDLFKKIGVILSELQDQYQFLSQNLHNLNELELELFLANANFLSDHVLIVKKVNSHKVVKEIPEHSSIVEPLPPEPSKKEDIQSEPIPVTRPVLNEQIFKLDEEPASFEFILNEHSDSDKFEFEEKEVGEIFDRPLSEEEERIIAQKQKLKEQKEQEITRAEEEDEIGPEPFLVSPEDGKEESAPEPPVIAEHPIADPGIPESPVKPTLNELLGNSFGANQKTDNLRTEVTDLKQAISLNDKLLYIKDLFNGYNLAYAEVIDLVNKMPDFKIADAFLQNNYAVKNDWKSKQATVDRFYELLNRRFPIK